MDHVTQHRLGIWYAIVGYTSWVLADVVIKRITEFNLPTYEIITFSSFIIGTILFAQTRLSQGDIRSTFKYLWPGRLRDQVILSSLNLVANYCCVLALSDLPLDIFYVSVFSAPLVIALLGHFFLAEKLDPLKSLAIVMGFLGVIVAIWTPHHSASGHLIGYLAGFGSALAFAFSVTWSRHLTKTETALSMTFFNAIFQFIICGFLTSFLGGSYSFSLVLVLLILGAGFFNTYGNLLSVMAVSYAPAATVGSYHYTQLLTGAVLAFLIWHEIPNLHLVIGALLIIISGLFIVLHVGKEEPALR